MSSYDVQRRELFPIILEAISKAYNEYGLGLDEELAKAEALHIFKDTADAGYRKVSDVATEFIELIDDHFAKVREVLEEHLREYRPGYQRKFIFDLVDVLQKRIVEKIKKKYLGEDINAPTKESEGEG